MWLLLAFVSLAHAQTDLDLKAIQDLDEELPTFNTYKTTPEELEINRQDRKFRPPRKVISIEKIVMSGTQQGAISKGTVVRNLENNQNYQLTKLTYVNVFNLEDENGFKYIKNKNGTVTWRVRSRFVEPIKEVTSLYVPPLKYTPAPENIIRSEYDKKLSIPPEFSFYAGVVSGNFMADLFNDTKANRGISNQYGLHFFTDWKLPIKIGGVLHYERASYNLSNGNKVNYSAISFGPQLKSKDFEIFDQPLRFQTQFRVSPFARAQAEASSGNMNFKFNSYDLLASIERPVKNGWGEFVFGFYFQNQWLNLKDQASYVDIEASNRTNQSFGLSFSQVFQ